jgi:hypothetical protein|tara:strand:+ start:315 stop:626 length:312 start_codon:yes stop_codon:yes gene_type:complete
MTELHYLSEPTPELSVTRGIGPVFFAPNNQWSGVLGDLNGRAPNARGKSSAAQAIFLGSSASATCVKSVHHKRFRETTGYHPFAAKKYWAKQAGCTLSWHPFV